MNFHVNNCLDIFDKASFFHFYFILEYNWLTMLSVWQNDSIIPIDVSILSSGASLVAQRLKRLPAMQKTQVPSLGREDSLEKEMEIPWMEKPGRLQSTGSQRVGHDWVTSLTYSFLTLFPFRLLQIIKQSSMCYIVGPCWLSILNTAVCIC